MDGLVLIIYCISVAVAAMTLSLASANTVFHRSAWCRVYVVFQSCILATIFLGFLNKTNHAAFEGRAVTVFHFIFRISEHATMGFVTVLLPYFMKWLLGRPWGARERVIFYTTGIVYFGAGLAAVVARNNKIAQMVQTPLFIAVLAHTLVTLKRGLSSMDERGRGTSVAVIVSTLTLMPLAVFALFFPVLDNFAFPVYILAISIIMMVYFYSRFSLDSTRLHKKNTIDGASLDKFRITGREQDVIRELSAGLTNKEIAAKLGISVNTVNNHVANIFEKTGVRSRVELLRILNIGPWD